MQETVKKAGRYSTVNQAAENQTGRETGMQETVRQTVYTQSGKS